MKSIEEIKKRLSEATPGPYESRTREFSNAALTEVWTEFGWYSQLPASYREPTTEMFAHAPDDIAWLIERVEEMAWVLEQTKSRFQSELTKEPDRTIFWNAHEALTKYGTTSEEE